MIPRPKRRGRLGATWYPASGFGASGPRAGFYDRDVEDALTVLRERAGGLPVHLWGVKRQRRPDECRLEAAMQIAKLDRKDSDPVKFLTHDGSQFRAAAGGQIFPQTLDLFRKSALAPPYALKLFAEPNHLRLG